MSAPIDRTIDALEAAGCQPRRIGNGWQARCPAHDDREPSLSIGEGADDKVLLRCHAGCEPEAIVAALGLVWGDLFARKDDLPDAPNPERNLETFCERRKLTRKELSRWRVEEVTVHDRPALKIPTRLGVDRIKFLDGRPPKVMWAERGKGRAHAYGLTRAQRIGGETLYIVNGEPSVWACSQSNVPAVCTAAGEGVALGPDALAELAGSGFAKFAVVYDRDQAGRDGAHKLVVALRDAGLDARALELPARLGPGGDVDDLHRLVGDTGLAHALAELPELRAALAAVPDPLEPLRQVKDAATLEKALRELKAATAHLDSIGRQVCRERAIEALKAAALKVNSPAKLIGAALDAGQTNTVEDAPLLLRDVEPDPEPVEGDALLDEIRIAVRRFLVLGPAADVAFALWVVATHAHDAFPISPILAITSPVKRCGKTTALELIQALAPRPLPANNITAAALFRCVEMHRPTLLVDEADTFFRDSDELRGVVNSGHKRSMAYVVRTVGDDHEPTKFSTWSPKAVALIGRLPDTTEDRAIQIVMRRKTAGERVERFRGDQTSETLAPLARRIARWAADHFNDLRAAEPAIPGTLHDRAADNWRSLLAIADAAGGDWPVRARDAAVALSGADDDNEPLGVQALRDIKKLFANRGADRLASDQIVEHLVGLEDRPWPEYRQGRPLTKKQLASLLRRFGIVPKVIRVGDSTPRGYALEDLLDAFTRYLPPPEPQQLNNADAHCVFGDSEVQHPESVLRIENPRKLNADAGCDVVALPQGGTGACVRPDDDVELF